MHVNIILSKREEELLLNTVWSVELMTPKKMQRIIGFGKGMNCHINLIPVNPIKERDFVQSNIKVIEAFKNKLEKNGINVTIRREMGRDIDGACGQLRKKHIDKNKNLCASSGKEL